MESLIQQLQAIYTVSTKNAPNDVNKIFRTQCDMYLSHQRIIV